MDLCVNLGNNSSYSALLKDGVRLRGVKAFPVSTEDELKKSETAMIPESYGEQKAVVNTTFSLQVFVFPQACFFHFFSPVTLLFT